MIKPHHARVFEAAVVALIAAIAAELCAWGLGAQISILWASWLAALEFAALAPCYTLFFVAEGQSWRKSFSDARAFYLAAAFFAANAIAAKIFLHERVDRRRWMAALCVAAGVALLAG